MCNGVHRARSCRSRTPPYPYPTPSHPHPPSNRQTALARRSSAPAESTVRCALPQTHTAPATALIGPGLPRSHESRAARIAPPRMQSIHLARVGDKLRLDCNSLKGVPRLTQSETDSQKAKSREVDESSSLTQRDHHKHIAVGIPSRCEICREFRHDATSCRSLRRCGSFAA